MAKSEKESLIELVTILPNDANIYISEEKYCTTVKIFKDKNKDEIKEYFKGYFRINSNLKD